MYQCFVGNPQQIDMGPASDHAMRRMAEKEGFRLGPLAYGLYKWMSEFSFTGAADTLNTIYVVGSAMTDADTFASSLLRMFCCVVTAHLNDFSVKDFAPIAPVTRLLFFPVVQHALPFSNPIVNQILKGKETFVATGEEESARIKPIKCLVRLKRLPQVESLPTNKREHLILVFSEEGDGNTFFQPELNLYFEAVKVRDRADVECRNHYGFLCNSDAHCETCSDPLNIVSVADM